MTHRGRGECLSALNLYVISQLLISYSLILHVISKLFGTKDSGKEKCLPGVHLVHLQDEWQKRLILISSEDILYNLTSSEYMDSFFPVFSSSCSHWEPFLLGNNTTIFSDKDIKSSASKVQWEIKFMLGRMDNYSVAHQK